MEDENRKHDDLGVKDSASAIKFLLDSNFKSEDDIVNFKLLSAVAMQLSQQNRSPKLASEAFKVLSYLILNIHQQNIIEDITDIIAKAISITMKRVQGELDIAMEQLAQAVTESTDVGIQLNMDFQEVMAKIKLATESATMALVEGGSQRHAGKEGTVRGHLF